MSREADDLDFFHLLEDAALDTTGGNGAAAFNVEHVFDRHQERLIDSGARERDVFIDGVHEIQESAFSPSGVAFEGLEGAALDDRNLVAGELGTG